MARRIQGVDEELRQFLELQDDTQDNIVNAIADAVTRQIEGLCGGITFEPVTYTEELYDGDGTDNLFLNHVPVISVSELKIYNGSTWDTIDAADYALYLKLGKIILTAGDKFLTGPQYVSVTYSAGYTGVPPDVKLAAIKWISIYWQIWQDKREGVMTDSGADGSSKSYSVMAQDKVPGAVLHLLGPYRLPVIG